MQRFVKAQPVSDLPTREELKSEADYVYARTDNEVSRYTTLLTKLSNAYIGEVLMTREEWVKTLKNAPTIDLGDDNQWVMVDLGPWDE